MSDTLYRCDLPVYFTLTDARSRPPSVSRTKMLIHETKAHITLWSAVYPAQLIRDWEKRKKITYTVEPAVADTELATYAIPEGELCNCTLHETE